MIEESNDINEFEQALRESFEAENLKPGDVIQGMIVAVHGDVALVDVSAKAEAVLDRAELDELGTGDPVEVVVVSTGEEIRVKWSWCRPARRSGSHAGWPSKPSSRTSSTRRLPRASRSTAR